MPEYEFKPLVWELTEQSACPPIQTAPVVGYVGSICPTGRHPLSSNLKKQLLLNLSQSRKGFIIF